MFLVSKQTTLKTQFFGQEWGCNETFFYQPVFAKCEKLSFFLGPFLGQSLVDVQKHHKMGISAHF